jgi:hypothetical protein
MNRIIENNYQSAEPEVGMGVTELCYSDRHAYTVIAVDEKTITVQQDKSVRTDKNGMSDAQSYAYESNPSGRTYTLRKRKKDGHWVATPKGNPNVFMIGHRDEYYDFSR